VIPPILFNVSWKAVPWEHKTAIFRATVEAHVALNKFRLV
jgi:hypothetical protein